MAAMNTVRTKSKVKILRVEIKVQENALLSAYEI